MSFWRTKPPGPLAAGLILSMETESDQWKETEITVLDNTKRMALEHTSGVTIVMSKNFDKLGYSTKVNTIINWDAFEADFDAMKKAMDACRATKVLNSPKKNICADYLEEKGFAEAAAALRAARLG